MSQQALPCTPSPELLKVGLYLSHRCQVFPPKNVHNEKPEYVVNFCKSNVKISWIQVLNSSYFPHYFKKLIFNNNDNNKNLYSYSRYTYRIIIVHKNKV